MRFRASVVVIAFASLIATLASAQPRPANRADVETLSTFLGRQSDPFARANAAQVSRTVDSTRAAVNRSSNTACRADALAHVDAVTERIRATPTSARHAVSAMFEVRLRLADCEATTCDALPDVASAPARAVLWLSLARYVPAPPGTNAYLERTLDGGRAEAEGEDALALEAFRDAAAGTTCSVLRAAALRRQAGTQTGLRDQDAARRTIEQAIALLGPHGAARVRGDLFIERGFTFASQRSYEAAVESYAQARVAFEALGENGRLLGAWVDNVQGVAVGEMNRPEESIALNRHALAVRVPLLGEMHPDVLINMSNIAMQSSRRGDHATALETHRRIFDIRARVLEPDDASLAVTLEAMSSALLHLRRPQEVLPLCERAILIRAAGANAPDRPRGYACRANALLALGRPADALDDARRAEDLSRSAQGADHPDRGGYLGLLAVCAERAGDADLAATSRAEATRIRALRNP